MAYYALLDSNNVVTQVISGKDETDTEHNWETHYGNFHDCVVKRTSYNTVGNQHREGKTPFRKNYAGIGYTYDSSKDAFIPPKPYSSWVLNETTCQWEAPVSKPNDGKIYDWNDETREWSESTWI
tara:strand:- start:4283 stop:4657 length:375 start_codon:yes stop_codon:yes gene_type:complete